MNNTLTQLLDNINAINRIQNCFIEPGYSWYPTPNEDKDKYKYNPFPQHEPPKPPNDIKQIIDLLHETENRDRVRSVLNTKEYICEFDLPGCKKENINIEFNEKTLYIDATRNYLSKSGTKEEKIHRSVNTGNIKLDLKNAKSTFIDGVLRITIPVLLSNISDKTKIIIS